MLDLPLRPFARGRLRVSALGLGAGALGDVDLGEDGAEALLAHALELGINVIDTAPAYGRSEARIARFLAGRRRDEVILSTKVGYGVPWVADWTPEAVRLGVEQALLRFKTDYLDIVHLHSCPTELLERGEVPAALVEAVKAGKVRVAAYSGDGHPLYVSTKLPGFSAVQASLSILDRNNAPTLSIAKSEHGFGTLAKRALANAPWRYAEAPEREDEAQYWWRWREMALALGADPAAIALRWVVHHTDVDCALVGTRQAARLDAAVAAVAEGPLPDDLLAHLDERWEDVGAYWPPLV